MDISVIIVSYNTAELTVACLQSVLASQHITLEVFVVDNASGDDSANIIRQAFPAVRVIANDTNRGFGVANNQALKESSGRYIVFLNPDTTVEPNTLASLIAHMDAHPEIGLAGPKVVNPDGSRQDSVSYRYPGHRYGLADLGALPGEIACVLGACQIASASLLKAIGGFDEDFFLYGEDQDICLRIRKRGLEIGFIEDSVIMHHGGQSEKTTMPAEVVRKKFRGGLIFYRKHYRPDTVRRLCRMEYRRATFRIVALRLQQILMPGSAGTQSKLERYKVIREEVAGYAR